MTDEKDLIAMIRERFNGCKASFVYLDGQRRRDIAIMACPVWPQHRIAWLKGTIRNRLGTYRDPSRLPA